MNAHWSRENSMHLLKWNTIWVKCFKAHCWSSVHLAVFFYQVIFSLQFHRIRSCIMRMLLIVFSLQINVRYTLIWCREILIVLCEENCGRINSKIWIFFLIKFNFKLIYFNLKFSSVNYLIINCFGCCMEFWILHVH